MYANNHKLSALERESEITCIQQTTCILRIHAEQVYARRVLCACVKSSEATTAATATMAMPRAVQPVRRASGFQFEIVNHWNSGTLVHNDTNVAFLHPIRINYSIEKRIYMYIVKI